MQFDKYFVSACVSASFAAEWLLYNESYPMFIEIVEKAWDLSLLEKEGRSRKEDGSIDPVWIKYKSEFTTIHMKNQFINQVNFFILIFYRLNKTKSLLSRGNACFILQATK